jgi:heterodisulfide reductase subunit B2
VNLLKVEEHKALAHKPLERYAFFVGCTIRVRAPYIEKLARTLFPRLGLELIDLDFSCCPTSRVSRDIDSEAWLRIAARNLALAEKEGLPILSMCTGCTQTLVEAKHILEDSDVRGRINQAIAPLSYQGNAQVQFFAELLHEKKEGIRIERPLRFSIAGHSGCHILRPSRILKFDDAENPVKLDSLITLLGADPVDYPKKTLCCGYPLQSVDPSGAERMMKDKISTIKGADCMVVLCPTCFEYFQLRMQGFAQKQGFTPVPVVHYMQLLGLAMGLSPDDVGWHYLRHKDDRLIQ